MGKTFAIGDVHGHAAALDALLAAISPQPADTLVMLGDYVDRGPESREVLDRLIALQHRVSLIPLLGNHEEMMLLARNRSQHAMFDWLRNGGHETLASYKNRAPGGAGQLATLQDVPPEHWLFMSRECRPYYETPTHLFVHANADPTLPLEKQTPRTLRWDRFNDPPPHVSGKILVCGHTPQKSGFPRFIGHAVCLDTGIHAGRLLTCLDVNAGRIWQSDSAGRLRQSMLEEHRVTAQNKKN